MELGPIQKQWLADLRAHPERQTKGYLGSIDKTDNMVLCCLGQALVTMEEMAGGNVDELFVEEDFCNYAYLMDGLSDDELCDSYSKLGLFDQNGAIQGNGPYESLVEMNDEGTPWPDIADFIEKNPEKVFKESK